MKANLQLFMDKFISVNQQKYADQPEVLALLENLTLGDIAFTRLEIDSNLGPGGRIADFESASRKFKAIDQQWICAGLGTPGIVVTTDSKVYSTADEIKALNKAGLYRLTAAEIDAIVVVLAPGEFTAEQIKTTVVDMVISAAEYVLLDTEFVWPETDPVVGTDFTAQVVTDAIDSDISVTWLPAASNGGETNPGEGGETDPGTGGGETGGEPEVDPNEPVITPEMEAEDKALADPTAGGIYSDVGDKGFGVLTVPREISEETANIATITGMTFGLVGAGSLTVETLNENA